MGGGYAALVHSSTLTSFQPDGRSPAGVFIADDAQRRGIEQEIASSSRVQSEPASAEDTQEMTTRKH